MGRSLFAAVAALAAGLAMSLVALAPAQAEQTETAVGAGFAPSSTSWTSASTGWVLGWSPCGENQCATLLHTTNGGATWSEMEAPPIHPSNPGAHTRVFFAERNGHRVGLITNGPELYVSYDAADSWQQLSLTDVELIGGIGANARSVFVVGHAQVGDRVSMQAFSTPINHPRWHEVPGVDALTPGSLYSTKSVVAGSGRSVQISTATYGGVVRLWTALNGQSFEPAYPCNPLSVMYPGIGADQQQFVLCSFDPGFGNMAKLVRTGTAADRFMTVAGEAPTAGITTDFAVSPSSAIAIGATKHNAGLVHMSFDQGRTWETPLALPGDKPMRDLAFQDTMHGVLVAGLGAAGLSAVYRTTDGGHTWTALEL